jgi:hypothetical protein
MPWSQQLKPTRMDHSLESAKVGIFQQQNSGFKMMKATSINKHGSPIKVMDSNGR